MASTAHSRATSEAYTLAMPDCRSVRCPASAIVAAQYISSRAACTFVAMSASLS